MSYPFPPSSLQQQKQAQQPHVIHVPPTSTQPLIARLTPKRPATAVDEPPPPPYDAVMPSTPASQAAVTAAAKAANKNTGSSQNAPVVRVPGPQQYQSYEEASDQGHGQGGVHAGGHHASGGTGDGQATFSGPRGPQFFDAEQQQQQQQLGYGMADVPHAGAPKAGASTIKKKPPVRNSTLPNESHHDQGDSGVGSPGFHRNSTVSQNQMYKDQHTGPGASGGSDKAFKEQQQKLERDSQPVVYVPPSQMVAAVAAAHSSPKASGVTITTTTSGTSAASLPAMFAPAAVGPVAAASLPVAMPVPTPMSAPVKAAPLPSQTPLQMPLPLPSPIAIPPAPVKMPTPASMPQPTPTPIIAAMPLPTPQPAAPQSTPTLPMSPSHQHQHPGMPALVTHHHSLAQTLPQQHPVPPSPQHVHPPHPQHHPYPYQPQPQHPQHAHQHPYPYQAPHQPQHQPPPPHQYPNPYGAPPQTPYMMAAAAPGPYQHHPQYPQQHVPHHHYSPHVSTENNHGTDDVYLKRPLLANGLLKLLGTVKNEVQNHTSSLSSSNATHGMAQTATPQYHYPQQQHAQAPYGLASGSGGASGGGGGAPPPPTPGVVGFAVPGGYGYPQRNGQPPASGGSGSGGPPIPPIHVNQQPQYYYQ